MSESLDITDFISAQVDKSLEDRLGEALAFVISYIYDVSQEESFNILEIAPAGQHTVGLVQSPLRDIMARASISEKLRSTKVQISGVGDIKLEEEDLDFTMGENSRYVSAILKKDDVDCAWLSEVFEANEKRPNIVFGRNIFDHAVSNVLGGQDQEDEITPAVINALPESGFVVVFNDSGLSPSYLEQDGRIQHIYTFTFAVPLADGSETKSIHMYQKKSSS